MLVAAMAEEESRLHLTNNEEEEENREYIPEWAPPELQIDISPVRSYHFYRHFRNNKHSNNFLQGIKWSPDGSCFVTCTNDNSFPIFSLPNDGCGYNENVDFTGDDSYSASLVIDEGEAIYDYCWYPYMSASDPVTCVFASTTRDHPIHLWDSTSGELRCTYRAYDAMDEITAAFCIGFNPGGTKIFAGYNKAIRVFDIHRPGREFKQHSTVQGNKEGQAGMISAIAFSPGQTGMLATGSYNKTTAIYREDNLELLYVLHGQEGGVTHVQFSKDGNYLYTGGRKDPYILCWDIRKAVDIVYKVYRSSENTNQRILFDIDPTGRHLGTGGQDGMVHLYNLQTGQWVSSFQAALDTVNGFSFHPYLPMAASSSGHRRYVDVDDSPEELSLSADENCASVWSFSVASTIDETTNHMDCADLNGQSEN